MDCAVCLKVTDGRQFLVVRSANKAVLSRTVAWKFDYLSSFGSHVEWSSKGLNRCSMGYERLGGDSGGVAGAVGPAMVPFACLCATAES